MKNRAWRIVKAKCAASAFSGEGAKQYGGRWNSSGVAVVYAAGSASLAMLEMLVHLQFGELLSQYVLFEISFEESLVKTIAIKELPSTWRRSPSPKILRAIGDDWIAGQESAVLRIPSVVVPAEWNYLVNPGHPDFAKITIGPKKPVRFDPRLVKTAPP